MMKTGKLIVNADDWGRDRNTTDRTLECVLEGALSSVSAMMFMEDSERAADIACARSIDAGLHLNFTAPFSRGANVAAKLKDHQLRLTSHLRRNRLSQVVFHPGLVRSFEYVVSAQLDEFRRCYGRAPQRIDGHHHMHLCSNVVFAGLLPAGIIVRRNFSFQSGEKGASNRLYRSVIDGILGRRHKVTDFFFSLPPMEPMSRVDKIFALAASSTVEVETHPVNDDEFRFLTSGEVFRRAGKLTIANNYELTGARTSIGRSENA